MGEQKMWSPKALSKIGPQILINKVIYKRTFFPEQKMGYLRHQSGAATSDTHWGLSTLYHTGL